MGSTLMESSKASSKKMPKKKKGLRINMPVSRWSISQFVFIAILKKYFRCSF